MHLHRNEDEILHVLEGDFRFWCGDWVRNAGAGATVVLPRGVPHAFRNVGAAPGRMLEVAAPGGFEGFFGRPAPLDIRPTPQLRTPGG